MCDVWRSIVERAAVRLPSLGQPAGPFGRERELYVDYSSGKLGFAFRAPYLDQAVAT